MNEESEKQNNLRKYLLGELSDETEMRRMEEKILLDNNFAEQLAIAEDELIDDYLDGTLAGQEHERFIQFFLSSPQMKEKMRLIRNLRKYAAKHADTQNAKQFSKAKPVFRLDWRKLFTPSPLKFAVIVVLLGGFGFAVWRTAFYQSNVERGLAQLRAAYRGQRPIESRTTANFDYARILETRGNAPVAVDEKARKLAERLLFNQADDSTDAEANRAVGLIYLADKKFEEALDEFNHALKLAPDNARLQSDAGAALYELSKKATLEENGAKTIELLNLSLTHIDKAIALDPKMPEPRFNRALCLQALFSLEPAKQAWRDYLEIDPGSQWAVEARGNLQNLELKESKERSADEVERSFLNAVSQKNNDEAWRLLSRNRELIQEKYLPQRLAMSFLKVSNGEKQNLLQALQFAGELEMNRIGDPFAADIARFYTTLPNTKVESLKQAQNAMRNGYLLSLKPDYKTALKQFQTARNLFVQADDIWEAKLSEYFIGYCLINIDHANEGIVQLNQVVKFSRNRNYKWLEVTSLYWLAGGFSTLKQHTQSKEISEKALALAEEINDSYAVQRNLMELARRYSFVGQEQPALDYLHRVLKICDVPDNSLRQKYRNYADAVQILTAAKFYSAANPIAVEAVSLADRLEDPMFESLSRSNAGVACIQTGDFARGRKWLNNGRIKAEKIVGEKSRKKTIAYSFLKSGYLERQAGGYEEAKQFYDEAVELYGTMEMPSKLYEAQKGRLLTYLALGQNAELDEQISVTEKLTEDYRAKILEEQERTSFFDTEESIYDIAVEYKFRSGKYEQAYNYTEMASSRSLLDWLQKGAKISGDKKNTKIWLEENVSPLTLAEIRERMPPNVQILQYSVLDDKVLIWLVSKEKFVVVPSVVRSADLREKVENYVALLKQKDEGAQKLGRELYELLVSPILSQLDPAREICLIPSKVLFSLPFAAVISPKGNPLLAEFNIFYAPSANVFLYCTENAGKKDTSTVEALLSVGNPAFDKRNFSDLPDLPTAETEAREIAVLYDNSPTLLGSKATKATLQSLIQDAEIIHFAGHYVVVPEHPLSSYLLLAQSGKSPEDGILTNSELVDKKLPRAKLVVLSACQTGAEQYYNGEGLIGLSRTFLAAGAPLVVASGWSVETEATAELMKRFHFYRRQQKMTTVAALRNAQLEMLNAPDGRFREPYYWAAFAAFGGYATF